ncbi:MAG: CocE/NonD family hydrolase, partial [Dehalococcoidia bacterium]|nr:CocE/NonD family hydrolase [Dehalococcoidia bacterium]
MSSNVFLPDGVETRYNVNVPMRDGINLSADIYFPRMRAGSLPAILSRTPYDNTNERMINSAIFYAQQGYVFVAQDTRGRYDSEGKFRPWVDEFNDGHDTVEWVGQQEWCDGNVGMVGGSYVGNVQWQAAAMGSKYLKTIVPRVIGNNLYESPHYQSGAFQLNWSATWSFRMAGRTAQDIDIYNWEKVFATLPLKNLPEESGKDIFFWDEWIKHPDYDDYWKALANDERYDDIEIPVLQIGGWYDFFTAGTFHNFVGMREGGGSRLARDNQRAIVGPWIHSASTLTRAGEVDFGRGSVLDLEQHELRWFDHWLKGIDNGADADIPLNIFVMGINQWRDENEWPLARTQFTPYYLHSDGQANSLLGDGVLSMDVPDKEPSDEYVYNPAFPTPTKGGCNCCNPEIVDWGAFDQQSVEFRNDVLVYTSEPLKKELEVTGPVVAKIFAETDVTDTDFTVKLVDVDPNGFARNLCDGIIRARYRKSTSHQSLLEPGTVYEFTVDLWPTSNVFLVGHRIRLD